MNGIIQGKQDGGTSLNWKTSLDIPVAKWKNFQLAIYSPEAFAYINSTTHHVRIDFVDGTISIIPIKCLLVINIVPQQYFLYGTFLNNSNNRDTNIGYANGLFVCYAAKDAFNGLIIAYDSHVAGTSGDWHPENIVKSIQIGYFE